MYDSESSNPFFTARFLLLLSIVFSLFFCCGAKVEKDSLSLPERNWLTTHTNCIRLGTEPYYNLYDYDNDGIYNGIAADYIKLVEKKLNFKFNIVRVESWEEENAKIISREIDVANNITGRTRLSNYMLFTKPYFRFPAAIIARTGESQIRLDRLKDLRVVFIENEDLQQYLERECGCRRLRIVSGPAEGLKQVSSGQADVLIHNWATANHYIKKEGINNLCFMGDTDYRFQISIASRNDWPILNRILEKGLAMISEGEREAIDAKWNRRSYFWNSKKFWYFVLCGLGLFFLVFGVILIWNSTLRRKVKQQTEKLELELAERKKREEEDRKHQEQLMQANKMISLGILVSSVAHEINNPNNSISLNASVLKDAWEDIKPVLDEYSEANHDLEIANIPYEEMSDRIPMLITSLMRNSNKIQSIVGELRDFSRKNPADSKTLIDLNSAVQSAIGLIHNLIKKKTRNFQVSYDVNLPKILGNSYKIEQVVINLIQNAGQALSNRDQLILVSTKYDHDNQEVNLLVKDEGTGIPKEDLQLIMEPFFTTKRSQGGIGLGLFISQMIVDDHDGRMYFLSTPGKGTTAQIIFPVQIPKCDEE